jgi:spore maturation protein CgeB
MAVPQLERATWNRVVREIGEFSPNLVLLTEGIPPEILTRIRRSTSAKVCCWYTDPVAYLHRAYLLAGEYDAVFVKEPYIIPTLRDKLDLNAHYLPEACNPAWHMPAPLSDSDREEFGCDVASAGSLHYYRARMLEPLLGHDLKIWGNNCPPWLESPARAKYQSRFVAETTKSRAFRAAKIIVNTMNYNEIDGVNCTLFEAAGAGAFQIADWKAALPALFEPESEVVTFRSRRELIDKIGYYLARPAEREAIAIRAARRAHADHTYERRLETIFATVGLKLPARPSLSDWAPAPGSIVYHG